METKKKLDISNLTLPLMGLVLVIAAAIFLFVSDNGFSGAEALGLQSTEFWIWVVVFVAIAALAGYKLYKAQKNEDTKPGLKTILLAVVLICITVPFARACTDKANKGVTAPKYEPK